jgi:hypothetical protein
LNWAAEQHKTCVDKVDNINRRPFKQGVYRLSSLSS